MKFSEKSLMKLKNVHPNLVNFFKELILITPYDFKIVEGVRSQATQLKYYTWGRTVFVNDWGDKVDKPITQLDGVNKISKHQIQNDGYGHAVDICFVGNNQQERYDLNKFKTLRKIAIELMDKYNIEWGGDWKTFKDYPHWQYRGDK